MRGSARPPLVNKYIPGYGAPPDRTGLTSGAAFNPEHSK
jgi:hypothetical protein